MTPNTSDDFNSLSLGIAQSYAKVRNGRSLTYSDALSESDAFRFREPFSPQTSKKRKPAFETANNMVIIVKMDGAMAKPELIASAAQDQQSWNLYTEQGEFFDQDPPSWQNLSRAEEILIKRRDWRARKRLLAYTSRRLRQERLSANGASNLEKTFISSGRLG